VLAPLDLDDVNYASGPCGALFQWLKELVLDRAKLASLLLEVKQAKEDHSSAAKAHEIAQQRVCELQSELEANCLEQQQLVAHLQKPSPHTTPTNANKIDVAAARRCCRRGKWLRPAFDFSTHLTVTMQGLKHTTWSRSCEKYKLFSPTQALESSFQSSGKGWTVY
jgi:hypothetical protein